MLSFSAVFRCFRISFFFRELTIRKTNETSAIQLFLRLLVRMQFAVSIYFNITSAMIFVFMGNVKTESAMSTPWTLSANLDELSNDAVTFCISYLISTYC